ncbi:ATP/GTP-binding protein [uncultured Aquitalea sp.]|uniref:GTP-binding protein n=1 Tax=uncultured Aquitalea sp. TaxID=540272 RepID=UPI0025FD4872|nr:ATP/GTP-binding protein [uncultured Aquitalea sp.]
MRAYDNKIIFAGPVGAGKTTAIGAISDIEPVTTDAKASDMTLNRKGHTTVALDYGVLKLDEDTKVHLYGTPGQERFDFMWDILSQGGIGLILLLDNSRPSPVKDLQFFLNAFRDMLKIAPLVIGITKTDIKSSPSIETYAGLLEKFDMRPPIFEIDARSREDVKELVLALLFSIDPGLEG